MSEPHLSDEIRVHYESEIDEDSRIRTGFDSLELVRVQEIIRSRIPAASLRVLDVGGASGVHAEWLLEDGHAVDLVDPVQRHVDQATARLGGSDAFTASLGDGRKLAADPESYDVVLLFGPLYHLTERDERLEAWSEARRVVKPGGLVFGMGISRFASLLDGLVQGFLFEPDFHAIVQQDLATGRHRNPSARPGWFTTAYFHHPDELADEASAAGLGVTELLAVEGPHASLTSLETAWEDPERREVLLASVRAVESEPTLLGMSPHIILAADRPRR